MAKGGAYYAAAGVANQVQPVDFGSIAKGFANVAESKRLEAKADAKYRQDFLMKQQELFGDEVIGEFDGTGIDNVDGVASKVKTAIKNHAEILNSLYEEGKISESQLNSRMRKLSSASAQYRGMVGNISNFIQKHNELGGKSSKYNEMVIERLNSFTEDMLPTVDENSNLAFLSKGGKTGIAKTSISQFQNMLSAKEGVNDSELFQGVMAGIKPSVKYVDGKVVSTFLPNDNISDNTKNYLKETFSSMSDDQLIDLAVKNDIDYGDDLTISDKKALQQQLLEKYESKTKSYLLDQEVQNEVEGIKLGLQKSTYQISRERADRESEKYKKETTNVLPPQSTVVKYNLNGSEGNFAARVWQMPIDKAHNIAPFIDKDVVMNHAGAVQLTQVEEINVGTADQPVYKYRIGIYVPPSKGKDDGMSTMVAAQAQKMVNEGKPKEEVDDYLKNMQQVLGTGTAPVYDTVDIDENQLLKLQKYFDQEWVKPKTNLNGIFSKKG
jgi:hypothetical protein